MVKTSKQKTQIQAYHKIAESATQTHTQKQSKDYVLAYCLNYSYNVVTRYSFPERFIEACPQNMCMHRSSLSVTVGPVTKSSGAQTNHRNQFITVTMTMTAKS
jgi:hypothetical protein